MVALTGQAPVVAAPDSPKPFSKGSSGDCLIEALAARGIPYRYLPPEQVTHPRLIGKTVLAFEIKSAPYYFDGGSLRVSDPSEAKVPGPRMGGETELFLKRKDLVKTFLRRHGISVPQGVAFARDAEHEADSYFTTLCESVAGGVCVKPVRGKKGREVHVGLRDLVSFRAAFTSAAETDERVLVEETVSGNLYRFTCLGGRVVAIECGRPANVEGDGVHTIEQLVQRKNIERRLNPGHAGFPLQLTERERSFLSRTGLGPDHVPKPGQQVLLSDVSNMHQGGEFIDVTDRVHQSYVDVIERAIKLLPDIVLCGADVVIEDASVAATNDNYHVLGLNRGPGIALHHYPWRGQPRDVAGAIIDYLASQVSIASRGLGTSGGGFSEASSGHCLVQTLAARGIAYEYLTPDQITDPTLANQTVVSFRINGETYYFDNTRLRVSDPDGIMVPGPIVDGEMALFARQKDLVKSFLQQHNVNVPRGATFPRDAAREAESYFTTLCRSVPGGVCVKPTDGRKGRHVHVGLRDLVSFRDAFAAVSETHERILIEETVSGEAYRFTCLDGRVIAIECGRPANVEGDGLHTIAELVDLKNLERRLNSGHAGTLLRLRDRESSFLSRAGLRPDDVPDAGQQVFLSDVSNMHQGGEFIDVTDAMHQSYIDVIERIVRLTPDLILCGVDVVVEDTNAPATEHNYHVLELNCGPGFSTNHHPWRGQPRDVAGSLIDYLTSVTPRTAF